MFEYAYITGCTIALLVWIIAYLMRPDLRREMLFMSIGTSWLGITQLLYVGEYWSPQYIFPILDGKIGFEDFLLTFLYGGIASVGYQVILNRRTIACSNAIFTHSLVGVVSIGVGAIIFLALEYFTQLNIIYTTTVGLFVVGVSYMLVRRKLISQIILNGIVTGLFFFTIVAIVNVLYPGWIAATWNISAISGYFILGVPIEEGINHFCLGLAFAVAYEVLYECRTRKRVS